VKTMGMVGLFVGPVLMALLVAIWREWLLAPQLSGEELKEPAPDKTGNQSLDHKKD